MSKVLIIGLDGATFDLIIPWINEGRLPNLARLMKEGSYGKLKSTPNKVSPEAWTSFSTGKNAGKHGIYMFHAIEPSTLKLRLFNTTHRDAEPIWLYLSRMGKKVGVCGVPTTFPVDKVNGFMLAGWDSPSIKNDGFCHPPDLMDEILKRFSHFPIGATIEKYKMDARPDLVIKEIHRALTSHALLSKHLIESKEWDLFVTVFIATDQVQHHFWHYLDDSDPMSEPHRSKLYRDAIRGVYEKCDEIIGDLTKNLDDDTTVAIMSDHGGTVNSQGNLYLPRWLEELGLAKKKDKSDLKSESTGHVMQQVVSRFIKKIAYKLLGRLGYKHKRYLKKLIGTRFGFGASSNLRLSMYDWSKTKVYIAGSNLRINLKGRELYGIVSPGKEYEDLRDFVIEKLCETRDIKTGRKVVKGVYKREEVYQGKHVDETWDLITAWTEGLVISGMICTDKNGKEIRITEKAPDPNQWSGQHSDYGIFIAKGPHIKSGKEITNAEIIDITPTVLHLMGFPVPDDMDGKVLTDIITESFLQSHPTTYTKSKDSIQPIKIKDYSEEEAKRVKEQLENVGYL
jgi:predicted AlkP superfamily phosphohydrolase/phosphomutase